MRVETDVERPIVFDPERYEGQAPPATPGWDPGLERTVGDGRTLARGLALFSYALGLAELLAPARVARLVGMKKERAPLVRLYGLREIAAGYGIGTQRRPTGWMWARVAGDALDLATLGAALGGDRRRRTRTLAAMGAVAGVTALDVTCALQLASWPSSGTPRHDGAQPGEGRAA